MEHKYHMSRVVTLGADTQASGTFRSTVALSFTPRIVRVKDVTFSAGGAAAVFKVWSDLTGETLFTVGAGQNTVVSKSLCLDYELNRRISNMRFEIRDLNDAVITCGANSVLYFTLEFLA